MGFLDIFTEVDDILRNGLSSIITELKTLNSKFSSGDGSDTGGEIIVNPTDNSGIENILLNIEDKMIELSEQNITNMNHKKETLGFEILNLATLTKDSIELPSPITGQIRILKIQGREELVKMEVYLGNNKVFPYLGDGYFPSSMETFETTINVNANQFIRVEFTNQDDTNTHTCQVYMTIHEI